jgi:hypothetical protein
MTEAVTINNEELAILCDIVSGWGVKSQEIRVNGVVFALLCNARELVPHSLETH